MLSFYDRIRLAYKAEFDFLNIEWWECPICGIEIFRMSSIEHICDHFLVNYIIVDAIIDKYDVYIFYELSNTEIDWFICQFVQQRMAR